MGAGDPLRPAGAGGSGAGAGGGLAGAGPGSGGGGAQETGGATGAAAAQGGFAALIEVGGGATGGSESGVGGDAGTCGVNALMRAIETPALLSCHEVTPTSDPLPGWRRGAIVIDDDGRIVDNTRIRDDEKQQWLDSFADQRFPCLAGQTITYECHPFE